MMKTLTKKLSSIVIILLGVLIACTPSTIQIPTPANEIRPSPTVEPAPTSTVTSTPAPNVIDLDSASELPLPTYEQECVNILQPNPDQFEINLQDFDARGFAVFSDIVNDNSVIVLYDLQSGDKDIISADYPAVSPNGKWLFYVTGKDDSPSGESMFVLSNSAGDTKTFPVSIVTNDYVYMYVHEWLDNNSLRLLREIHDEIGILLLDPFTEQVTKLPNKFNGLQSPVVKPGSGVGPADQYLDWGVDPFFDVIIFQMKGANVAYSPDKNLVFYPHRDGSAILYDVKNQKELARVVIPNWGELVQWSPSGEYISVIAAPPNTLQDAAKKDFYLIARDGKSIKRLTYLSEQFERVSIKEYAWSPDGTKIAFWLNTNFPSSEDEIASYELTIVDVTNGDITNYCLSYPSASVEELAGHAGLLIEPVWSPDGSQLMVPNRTPTKTPGADYTYDVKTFLFDPDKLSAMEIMESILLRGWMTDDQ